MSSQSIEEAPKNIVVWIRDNLGISHQKGEDGRICQVVHRRELNPTNRREPLMRRLGRRMGIQQQPELPSYVTAAAKAYEYVKENYRKGGRVVILADSDVSPDGVINAARLLAKCLFEDCPPPDRVEGLLHFKPNDAGQNRIPIKSDIFGVSGFSDSGQHVTVLNEDLQAKFSSFSIEHIICWNCDDKSFSSCHTALTPAGHVKSKKASEVCLCRDDYPRWFGLQMYLTKEFIDYIPEYVPNWDIMDNLVWEKDFQPMAESEDTSQGRPESEETTPLPGTRGERPAGAHSTQLRKYNWEDNDSRNMRSCLLWEAYYD
ncbi:hypothetical protein RhiXN_05656 [Rhizoctonia solani]|uniref:Uncharacterized protein n=1 Tax=Rhizoctonia solani TaxID=456999 RepID=A0A8H8SXL0_9AGAM|nr:uncharacterized protein RhiXN_05656 [Rhizoctonia solani]QRW20667.1 hypothetical protein RhiXN_05656 [Rhizoctonia solani]